MLGSLSTQQLFASANSIAAIPQVNAEWNYNAFIQPAIITSSSATQITSVNLNASTSWSSASIGGVNNGTVSQSIAGLGLPTFGDTSASALVFTTLSQLPESGNDGSGNITSRFTSSSISLGTEAKGKFYKFTFYVKVGDANYTDGFPSTIAASITSITNPSSTSSYYYRVVGIGSNGQSLGPDVVNNTDLLTASAGINSDVTLTWAKNNNSSSYRIYRSRNRSSTSYITTTSDLTYVDRNLSNSGYTPKSSAPAVFSSHIQVSPEVVANNSASSNVQIVSFVRSANISTGKMEKIQASVDASLDVWKKVEVWFGSPGTVEDTNSPRISNVTLNLNLNSDYEKSKLLVDHISLYEVTEHDFFLNEYFPADSAFSPLRPGEALLNSLLPVADRTIDRGTNFPKIKPVTFAVKTPQFYVAKDILSPQIQIIPSTYDKFKYYISDTSQRSIQAQYDTYLSINKIVLKYATTFNTITTGSVTIYTGSANTASVIPLVASDFTASGITVLYYNGSNWSTSSWSSPPALNADGSLQNVVSQVRGIAFKAGSVTQKSFRNYGGTRNFSDNGDLDKLHIVELSPRLEVDLSSILQNYSIKKDLTSPNSNGFPLSYINSNSGNINFSNIPIYQSSGSAFTIFENQSKNATFYNLMKQGVKFTGFLKSPSFQVDLTENVPQFVMYSNSWSINDIGDVSVDLYDITKIFSQGAESPQYSAEKSDLFSIVTAILNLAGFSDYDYDGLRNVCMSSTRTTNFWFDESKTVFENLQDIFLTHQIGAFIDEYGVMRFKSLSQIFNQLDSYSFSPNFAVTDTASVVSNSRYISNIVPDSYSESISEKIGKVVARYRIAQDNDSTDVDKKNKGASQIYSRNTEVAAQIWQEDDGIGLPSFELNSSLLKNQSYMSFDPEKQFGGNPRLTIANFEGDLLIGNEVVGYSGMEYRFYAKGNNNAYVTKTVKSYSDISEGISELKNVYSASNITSVDYKPTGKLFGLQRGKYGTFVSDHYVSSSVQNDNNFSFYTYSENLVAAVAVNQSKVSAPKASGLSLSSKTKNEYVFLTAKTNTTSFDLFAIDFRVPTAAVAKQAKYGSTTIVRKKNGDVKLDANGKPVKKVIPGTPYSDFHNLAVGIFFNMNPNVVSSTTASNCTHFIEIASTQAKTGQKKINYNLSLYRITNNTKVVLIQNIPVHQVFDGESHRLSAYIDGDSISIALDNKVITKVPAFITNKPSNKFGAYIKNLENQSVEVYIDEVYGDAVQPVNRASISIYDYDHSARYYFTTKEFLNNMIKNVPNYSNPFLFQSKPQARGIKFYDVKFGLSPAYPETAKLIPIQYGSRTTTSKTNAQANILGPVVASDLKYSSLHSSPFRSKFAVVNNCEEIVYLNSPADNDIIPLHINAQFQKLLEEQTIERIIDLNYINNSIELNTEWLPSSSEVEKLIALLSKGLNSFYTDIEISIFGNPLIQVGDFAQITYSLKRIGYDPTPNSGITPLICLVTSVSQGFNGGVDNTQLTLKPIIIT